MLGGVGLAPKIHGPTLRVLTLSSGSPRAADCALFAILGAIFMGLRVLFLAPPTSFCFVLVFSKCFQH